MTIFHSRLSVIHGQYGERKSRVEKGLKHCFDLHTKPTLKVKLTYWIQDGMVDPNAIYYSG